MHTQHHNNDHDHEIYFSRSLLLLKLKKMSMSVNGEKGAKGYRYRSKDDKVHERKMKKLQKDLLFFKVSSMKKKNRGREERLRHLKQIKGIREEIARELKSTVARKERENGYMQKALARLDQMKKEKERLEKISEDKERRDKEQKQRKQEQEQEQEQEQKQEQEEKEKEKEKAKAKAKDGK